MKKGISLPLNAIILIIIGVTVLIAVLIAFTTNLFGNTESAQMESAVSRGCMLLKYQMGCDITKASNLEYKIGNRKDPMSLDDICKEVRGVGVKECCGC